MDSTAARVLYPPVCPTVRLDRLEASNQSQMPLSGASGPLASSDTTRTLERDRTEFMELLHTAHVPAGPGPFPTILALHGWGASAHDLLGIAPLAQRGEVLFLCPQGPLEFEAAPGQRAYGWFPMAGGGEIDLASIVGVRGVLEAFVEDALEMYPIDPEKLVILGFSQGGVMAYDLALGRPERFAALVALSSWLPDVVVDALPES